MPSSPAMARVRIGDGAPEIEAIINGTPQNICACYLQVDGQTVTTQFDYGSMTQFLFLPPGTHKLTALDDLGYRVGPEKSTSLSAGKNYTLIFLGSYPHYRVVTFEEPAQTNGAQLSLYEASPTVPKADFGSYAASSNSNFKQLGSATFGNVVTVSLGSSVSNFGGYVGKGTAPFTDCTSLNTQAQCRLPLSQVDSFDKNDVLPFHNASRLSLFLFDVNASGGSGPVFGSLDR